ncbi:MAG: hypothetical protein BRC47_00140 [Cyanobacteria bacterium QS_7_48_42]|jgi:uncharacterized membrane protein|nr:MAG: hypothetical protein BRC35_05300 [Cyanobacteria bacterium QH_10_48_56]PSO67294.1 MAG: hypothetical protein BRC39_01805 [Cyanobacteria bacterium QH_7_48_89]PSO71477.1 MAG: hypothetical protein BRC42_07970 [Cyanobacteria bacterium QS_1_48_34]PSO78221.1 MAG: hypothetical protein BRC44_11500 [Cyanobacteria bacterium QS_4_48_99]PSO85212.1 MAG: hypothetical protein BRC45_04485 [Cyanobacteria bacterium QS_5_48_63]PSO93656.1 MAG: hypothetical protein BRC48_12160 [Cyanobacteria bacterium QS_9_4
MQSGSYEFNSTQEKLVQALANKMRFVSFFLIAIGILRFITGIVALIRGAPLIDAIISGIIILLIGFWTYTAASSFNRIVKTQGNDIENLMNALKELRKLYTLQFWLFIIVLIAIIIAIIASIFTG